MFSHLTSDGTKLPIRESDIIADHSIASITCLLSGWEIFSPTYPEFDRRLRTLKGIHSFHVYANEHWLDYIMTLVSRTELSRQHPLLHSLLESLSSKLEDCALGSIVSVVENRSNTASSLGPLRQYPGLYFAAESMIQARTPRKAGNAMSDSGKQRMCHWICTRCPINNALAAPQLNLQPITELQHVLSNYQLTIKSLLAISSFPEIAQEELSAFKRDHRRIAFTCRIPSCSSATIGFDTEELRNQHEATHKPLLKCPKPDCQYPPFISLRALKSHEAKCLEVQPRTIVRRIRRMPSPHKVSNQEPAKVSSYLFLDAIVPPDDFFPRSPSLSEGIDPLGFKRDFETTNQTPKIEILLDALLYSLSINQRQELQQSLVKGYGYPSSTLTGAVLVNYLGPLIHSSFSADGYVALDSQGEQEMAERMVSTMPDLWKISLSNQILDRLPFGFRMLVERHRPSDTFMGNVYYLRLVCESLIRLL